MAISFPTSLDALTNPVGTDLVATVDHAGQHSDVNDAVEALEAKVGVNNSAVTSSLDYLVKNASSSNPGHRHTTAHVTAITDKNYVTDAQLTSVSARAINFGAATPDDFTMYVTVYAPFAFTINSVQNIQTSSGTITVAVKINGTNVTGLSAMGATSSSQDFTATAANTVAVGDEVTVVLSSNSSAANLRGTILITV